jgi:phospholipid transport system substrate-binding protein
MQFRSFLLAFGFAVAVAVAALPSCADAATATPEALITELGNKTVSLLQQKQLSDADREKQFRTLLHEGFDMMQMSRFVLGPYWRSASESQRQEFVKLFEDYIVIAYSGRFSQYSGEQFKIVGSRPEGDSALVTSQILRPNGGPPIKVDWRVGKEGAEYKIVDVVVEGVSLLVTQRQEFASVIQRNGGQLDALMQLMRDKTRR